ncbi:discoidin domain-containing protein [Caldalkalibacillus horti]|uniref:F5/8 type C domain-containing protein n=1 Tax=Caldalkalibacillus horti TaxID=77523 RepID=A0ABT9VVX9_9BACI|nr:discoidin domain-containing protein [Bacillus horti]MDQ0165157.1 hypothetical protein [Bacillus horti]
MDLEMLDLRRGNSDRSSVYIAANGVVVTSSANTYSSGSNYYLAYLFNRSYGTSNTQYWMTGSSGNQSLTFDLRSVSGFHTKKIRIYPYSRTNASSNYRIDVSRDGHEWEQITGWINNHHSTNNSNYIPSGQYREHDVDSYLDIRFIRLTLTRNGSYGVALNEIELYGVTVPPPNRVREVFVPRQRYLAGEQILVNWLPTTDPEGRPITYKVDILIDGVWRNMAQTTGREVMFTVPNITTFMDSKIRVIPCNSEHCNEPTETEIIVIAPYVTLLREGNDYLTINEQGALEHVNADQVSMVESGMLTLSSVTQDILLRLENPKIIIIEHTPLERKVETEGIAKIGFTYEAKLISNGESTFIPLSPTFFDNSNVVTIIQSSIFNIIPSYKVLVYVYLENGITLLEAATVSIINTAPVIDASFRENMLNIVISDQEGDLFKYQVKLNDQVIYPVHREWSDFTTRMEFSRQLNSRQMNISEQNRIEITAKDHYGEENTKVIEFIGEYIGLMFTDMAGDFYSTELGEVLKYMQIAPMMAGQSSLIYSVKLINFYNFKVQNVLLWSSNRDIDGLQIQLSKTASPFEPIFELNYGELELNKYDEIIFYVRLVSHHSALIGGVFDVFTKAKAVASG